MLLIADAAGDDQAAVLESRKFPLRGSRARTGVPNQLGRIDAPVGLAEKHTEDALLMSENVLYF